MYTYLALIIALSSQLDVRALVVPMGVTPIPNLYAVNNFDRYVTGPSRVSEATK